MEVTVAIAIVTLIVCGIFYNLYVGVIKAKNKTQEAFSSIDVQLKKRYDLIPNVLKIANKFMEHERNLLEELTSLRTQAMGIKDTLDSSKEKFNLDKQIVSKMSEFMVAVENYPDLKSDKTMVEAMQAFQDAEEHIAAARRFYNSAVLELNNKVEIFPSSIFAAMCGIAKQEFFEAEEVARASINASDYLK